VRTGGNSVGGCAAPPGVGVGGMTEGPFAVAEPGAGMPDPGVGGRTGCIDVVAPGLEGGASDALRVTRTVSLFNGMLEVREVVVVASCFTETAAVFRGGSTEPVCFETGTLEVWRGGGICDAVACEKLAVGGLTTWVCPPCGRIGCFINGTLPVCLDSGVEAPCFIKGMLPVCLDGASGAFGFISGTLAVCFEGGASAGFGGVEDCFSGSLMRLWFLCVWQTWEIRQSTGEVSNLQTRNFKKRIFTHGGRRALAISKVAMKFGHARRKHECQ